MPEDPAGLTAHLRALSTLHASQLHAMRSLVGNLTLHAGLLRETLGRTDGVTAEGRDRLEQLVVKIDADARVLLVAIERWLNQTRLDREPASFALSEALRDLEALLRPYAMERQVQCTMSAAPSTVVGDAGAVQRTLLAPLVDRLKSLPAGGGLDLRLDPDASPPIARLEVRNPGGSVDRREFRLPVERESR